MIPKTIHYCWFGGNPLPASAKKCINSWRKYLPEYEIKEWNETNFPIEQCPEYATQAYSQKKWAFVSDYARFKILFDYGGLYFDTDVELIRPIDDIIAAGPFMGCGSTSDINAGLGLAAAPGLGLYKDILDFYSKAQFDGTGSVTVVQIVTDILKTKGFENVEGVQTIEGVNLFPPDYFSPIDYLTGKLVLTKNTRSIHHYDASWMEPKDKYAQDKARLLRRILSEKNAGLVAEFIALIKYEGIYTGINKFVAWCKKQR